MGAVELTFQVIGVLTVACLVIVGAATLWTEWRRNP